ncbi:galactinol synthase [Testicularia cyperi]|uniref:Galactinol synthase n=1 Tax=Testicularia cyperi TaxID=1882483 RepID=A0A317Y0I3_9BASI|nr:galactinol synthase [Testicularia cyperi]
MTIGAANPATNGTGTNGHGNGTAPRCAWATLMTSEHLLPGLVVFAESLLVTHGSQYPLVVMVTSKLSERGRAIIGSLHPSVVVRDIEPIYPASVATSLAYARFNEVWTKLRAFDLDEYDRVVLVDSDMLVRRNMDELFSLSSVFDRTDGKTAMAASWACTCNPNRIPTYPAEWIPANCGFTPQSHPDSLHSPPQPDVSTPEPAKLVNSGLVVLSPSASLMQEMIEVINTDPRIPGYRFPDQDFLANFFNEHSSRTIQYLPWTYNALKKLRLVHPNLWRDQEVRNVHYILDKPWSLGQPGSANNPIEKDADHEIHSWWWSAFHDLQSKILNSPTQVLKPNKNAALSVSPRDWNDCVVSYVNL